LSYGSVVKSPVFPFARKISGLIEAVAIFVCGVITVNTTARNDELVLGVNDSAEPLVVSLLPREGGGCEADGG
jgi:cation transport regulator ChaC